MHKFQPAFAVCGIRGRDFAEARYLGAQSGPGGDEDAPPEAWKDQGANNDETHIHLKSPVVDWGRVRGKMWSLVIWVKGEGSLHPER